MSHPHDSPDTILAELVTYDLACDFDNEFRCRSSNVWLTSEAFVVHRKKLHIRHRGHLFEVGLGMRHHCKVTGEEYLSAHRYIPDRRVGTGPNAH